MCYFGCDARVDSHSDNFPIHCMSFAQVLAVRYL